MANQRQVVGYGPNGPVYADPAFGGTPPPADFAFGGSPSAAATPAAAPDPVKDPIGWAQYQMQQAAGQQATAGAPSYAPGAPRDPVNPTNTGAGGGGNALGLIPNSYGPAMANPDLLSAAYNMTAGVDPNSGISKLNSNYGNNANYLYLVTQGSNALGGTPDDYFNWANNYLQQGNTQGGSYVTSGQVLHALFDPTNPLSQNLYAKDQNGNAATPDVIVNRFLGLMQASMKNSAPPLVINAMTSMYEQAGNEWQVLVSQGKYRGTLTQYLTEKGLDPASLGM